VDVPYLACEKYLRKNEGFLKDPALRPELLMVGESSPRSRAAGGVPAEQAQFSTA
jgi:hypothetical protein